MPDGEPTLRITAVADLHCSKASQGGLQPLFAQVTEAADVLAICGDLTNSGLPEEALILSKALGEIGKIPVVAVLGNHDYESGKQDEIQHILVEAGAIVLRGEACELYGVGFAGAKGFAGGFGDRSLQPWGEETVKRFVGEAVDEALKLESALAKLRTVHRIALLHYAPIRATVEGEAPEIFPFLGSSRLEEPLTRYPVAAVFHGHAHHGTVEGRLRGGIPVYNVSMPLLRRAFPHHPPFRVFEVQVAPRQ